MKSNNVHANPHQEPHNPYHSHVHAHGHAHTNSNSSSRPSHHPQVGSSRYWRDVLPADGPSKSTAGLSAHNASSLTADAMSSAQQWKATSAQSSTKGKNARQAPTRQFSCGLCQHRFERRGHLESHVETVHEGKRPHRCPRGCGKVFGHRSSLQRHIKQVHENPQHRDFNKTVSKPKESGNGHSK